MLQVLVLMDAPCESTRLNFPQHSRGIDTRHQQLSADATTGSQRKQLYSNLPPERGRPMSDELAVHRDFSGAVIYTQRESTMMVIERCHQPKWQRRVRVSLNLWPVGRQGAARSLFHLIEIIN